MLEPQGFTMGFLQRMSGTRNRQLYFLPSGLAYNTVDDINPRITLGTLNYGNYGIIPYYG